VTRAHEDKAPQEVAAMFDDIADGYDRLNAVLKAVKAQPGERVLDLAAGTGTSSVPFVRAGAQVVPTDFSLGMLEAGKAARPRLPFTAGDAVRLPFADASFDAVSISFGLRNVVDPDTALREMLRVTRPEGRLVICEFSHVRWLPLRRAYEIYLDRVLTPVAGTLSRNTGAYDYLGESIKAWPDQPALAARIAAAGWREVAWRNLSAGIVALHRGRR
jgi:demethylmenaquinone methyltransferase/2-methoxy-6-polyprenyl-1,4-benzoquinol methylase